MDRILFGDNQFFGVNHMSEEKARQQGMRFQDIKAVIQVLDDAYAENIKTFMCTTHERTAEICDHFRANAQRYPGYKFYPCLPYAHKYCQRGSRASESWVRCEVSCHRTTPWVRCSRAACRLPPKTSRDWRSF